MPSEIQLESILFHSISSENTALRLLELQETIRAHHHILDVFALAGSLEPCH